MRRATPSGSSTPSGRLRGHNRSSTTSVATRIVSPSPTTGCSTSSRTRSASPIRITGPIPRRPRCLWPVSQTSRRHARPTAAMFTQAGNTVLSSCKRTLCLSGPRWSSHSPFRDLRPRRQFHREFPRALRRLSQGRFGVAPRHRIDEGLEGLDNARLASSMRARPPPARRTPTSAAVTPPRSSSQPERIVVRDKPVARLHDRNAAFTQRVGLRARPQPGQPLIHHRSEGCDFRAPSFRHQACDR